MASVGAKSQVDSLLTIEWPTIVPWWYTKSRDMLNLMALIMARVEDFGTFRCLDEPFLLAILRHRTLSRYKGT